MNRELAWSDFIPGTSPREVGHGTMVWFQPLRSWHSLTYAGEGLREVSGDGSGCLRADGSCSRPLTVTHRVYWKSFVEKRISAFLSYPGAMGYFGDKYFWEIYTAADGDIARFETESEMEEEILKIFKAEKEKI